VDGQLVKSRTLTNGFGYLEHYFSNDLSLTPQRKKQLRDQIDAAKKKSTPQEQAKAVTALLLVRRRDLPATLEAFGCESDFLNLYFPKRKQ